MGTLTDLINYIMMFLVPYVQMFTAGLEFLFVDLPPIFGLSIGWWLVGIMTVTVIVKKVFGGNG